MDKQVSAEWPVVYEDGTVHIPSLDVPLSNYMSESARAIFVEQSRSSLTRLTTEKLSVPEMRGLVDEYYRPLVARSRELFGVKVHIKTLAGVKVNEVTPSGAPLAQTQDRVLINLHGGAFVVGAELGGLLESIPIAATGRIRVIAVDYRLAPENRFPTATDDVVAVYKELLRSCRSDQIGIYGCSSGGLLAAEVTAALQASGLPRPGALGIFFSGLDPAGGGDSNYLAAPLNVPLISRSPRGVQAGAFPPSPYFRPEDCGNPLAFPALSSEILSKFPASLVITGSRDRFMSPAIFAHAQLVKLGVPASLNVWEGMWHGFLYQVDMPEAKDAYEVIASFFGKHLGRNSDMSRIR